MRIQKAEVRNRLLQCLADDDFSLLQPFLARHAIASGQTIAEAGSPLRTISFPEGAIAAVLIPNGGQPKALGIIGCEGFVGWPALLGVGEWPHEVVIRADTASAVAVEVDRLEDACRQSLRLRSLLLRFVGTFMTQMSGTLVANAAHSMEQRLARWILLYHDRLDGDEIILTHQEIGIMLGVRRASATNALHLLEGSRAIRSTRGRILIRDRAELERIAGDAYGAAERQYRQLIGPFGKSCPAGSPPQAQPAQRENHARPAL